MSGAPLCVVCGATETATMSGGCEPVKGGICIQCWSNGKRPPSKSKKFTIVETVVYEIEARSKDEALAAFLSDDARDTHYFIEVSDRYIEEVK